MSTVIVLAKEPQPGNVKTRLVPPLTHADAAALAAAALRDTLAEVDGFPGRRVLAFAGDPRAWLPRGWTHARQPSGGLDERIAAAFGAGIGPTVLVGMDTPQLTVAHLQEFDPDRYDACLGLARDGGYWVLGLADPTCAGAAVRGVPMSTPGTGAAQLHRLRSLGLRVQLLAPLTDVDTIATAHAVAAEAPHTRFAAALADVLAAA